MKKHSSLDGLSEGSLDALAKTDYDPSQEVKGTLVVTGYLPAHRKGRVEFFYEIRGGQSPVEFQRLLKKNDLTSHQLFSMFCAGWAKESTFENFISSNIELDVLMFGDEDTHGNHCLKVAVRAIGRGDVTFSFKLKSGTGVTLTVNKNEVVNTVYRVVPHYYADTMVARKKAMVKNSSVAAPAVYNAEDDSLPAKLKESISRDQNFPKILREVMGYEPETKEIIEFKNRLRHLIEDEKTADIKQQLRAEVEAKLPEFDEKMQRLMVKKKALEEMEQERKAQQQSGTLAHVIDDDISSSEQKAQNDALLLEIDALIELCETHPKHAMVHALLKMPYISCIKHYAVAYIVLEHVLPMLYDESEQNPDQTLYVIVRDWMHSIQASYLMNDFDGEAFVQHEKFYRLSEHAKAAMHDNVYKEKYYTAERFIVMVKHLSPVVDIHEAFSGTSYHEQIIYFAEDLVSSRVKIWLDFGFMIILPLDDFYLGLRKEKITLAYTKLIEMTQDIPLNDEGSAVFSVFKTDPNESFVRTMNPLNEDQKLVKQITCEVYPHVQLVSVLSVEEKISLLVSLWIIKCRFHSEDWSTAFNNKKNDFVKMVDEFLAMNCNETDNKHFFKKDDLLAQIAFYIAKNLARRVPNMTETSVTARDRLTLDQRVALIKAIYHDKPPFGNANYHNNKENPNALRDYVEQLRISSISLVGQEYMQDYWSMARPYLPYIEAGSALGAVAKYVIYTNEDEDVQELTELTDFMMALNNASFLDTYSTNYNQNTNDFVQLRKRRECLLELMFHMLILKIDPLAKKKFATAVEASYAKAAANFINSSVSGTSLSGLSITEYDHAKVEEFKRELSKIDELLGVQPAAIMKHKKHKHIVTIEKGESSQSPVVVKKQSSKSGGDQDDSGSEDDIAPTSTPLPVTTVSAGVSSAAQFFMPELNQLEKSIKDLDPYFNSRSTPFRQGSAPNFATVTDQVTEVHWIDGIRIRYTNLLLKRELCHASPEAKKAFVYDFNLLLRVVMSTKKFIKVNEEAFTKFLAISLDAGSLFAAVDDCFDKSFELEPFMQYIAELESKPASAGSLSLHSMYQSIRPIIPFGSNTKPDDKMVFKAMLGRKEFSVLKKKGEVDALIAAIAQQEKPEYIEAKLRLQAQLVRIEVREDLQQLRAEKKPDQIAKYIRGILEKTADAETSNPYIKQIFANFPLLLDEFRGYLKNYNEHNELIKHFQAIWVAEENKLSSSSTKAVYLPNKGSPASVVGQPTQTSAPAMNPADF